MIQWLHRKTNKMLTVSEKNKLPVTTTIPEDVSLVDRVAIAGSAVYAAETSKSITLEFYGSTVNTSAAFTFEIQGPSGRKSAYQGIRQTAPKDLVTSAKVGETVSFTVPAGFNLIINYTAPSTGALSVQGTVE
ncbi:hypothetical protein P9222_00920 [Paenibacillus amylolyticus]|nr:hypothetical protein [Paenibacillus amylolyticus]WFR63044.1 hypothetical protein P9222_00920 [Paenibacillus amylolyticus]